MMETLSKIRIGTRSSRLAMVQTEMVADALRAAHAGLDVEIVKIETSGEWKPSEGETRLSEAQGGKGLFAKEIEEAILAGHVDCGIHSMKDMSSFLPDGLAIDHVLPREDARDALICNDYKTLDELPAGAVVGTSSLRRQAMILARRLDLKVVPFRGNVPTRIEKLRGGQVDATLLALSGLNRLGLADEMAGIIEPEIMLPAACQGTVGIETRAGDEAVRALFDLLHCAETGLRTAAERAALQILDGSCHTPIGAYAVLDGGNMHLRVMVARLDGSESWFEEARSSVSHVDEARALGERLGVILKGRIPDGVLSQIAA